MGDCGHRDCTWRDIARYLDEKHRRDEVTYADIITYRYQLQNRFAHQQRASRKFGFYDQMLADHNSKVRRVNGDVAMEELKKKYLFRAGSYVFDQQKYDAYYQNIQPPNHPGSLYTSGRSTYQTILSRR